MYNQTSLGQSFYAYSHFCYIFLEFISALFIEQIASYSKCRPGLGMIIKN